MKTLPQVRASWLKYTIRCAKAYRPPEGPRILAAIGNDLRKEIREAGPLDWVPGELFIRACSAIREAVGASGARGFWQKSLHDCIQQPLIRPLAMGGLYLFGRSPDGLYRRTPQAWSLVTRKMGEMSTEAGPGDNSIWVRVRALPENSRSQALLHMWEGGFVGQAQFVDCHATVDTNDSLLGEGCTDFLVRWRPAIEVGRNAS